MNELENQATSPGVVAYQSSGDGPLGPLSDQVQIATSPHASPAREQELSVRTTSPSRQNTAIAALLGVAGGVGLVGLIRHFSKNNGEPGDGGPTPWGQTGFIGSYYGGPNGLGLLVRTSGETTSIELNEQKSVWVVRPDSGSSLYFISERMHVWHVEQPFAFDDKNRLIVTPLSSDEVEQLLEFMSLGNQQTVHSDYFPILDVDVTFSQQEGYGDGRVAERKILFPIPQSCGLNAGRLTQTGLSADSNWLIEEATISITPIKRIKKWWGLDVGSNTDFCRVTVSAPVIGRYSYVTTMRKSDYIFQKLRPLGTEIYGTTWLALIASLGWSALASDNVDSVSFFNKYKHTVVKLEDVEKKNKKYYSVLLSAISFWSNSGGVFCFGREALSTLVGGFSEQVNNCIAFLSGNWLNGAIDAIDLSTLFRTIMISPAPVCSSDTTSFQELEYFCWCWLASTRSTGTPVSSGAVTLPEGCQQIVFPYMVDALGEFLRDPTEVNLSEGVSLRDALISATLKNYPELVAVGNMGVSKSPLRKRLGV